AGGAVARGEGGELLLGLWRPEEVGAARLEWRALCLDAGQRLEPGADARQRRLAVEERVRVAVLRVDPGARLGAVVVLEPAVGVGELDAVKGLLEVGGSRRRGGGEWRRGRGAAEDA